MRVHCRQGQVASPAGRAAAACDLRRSAAAATVGARAVGPKIGLGSRLAARARAARRAAAAAAAPRRAVMAAAAAPRGRALISVSDKTGMVDFAKGLAAAGFELVSTGGSAAALAAAGVPVTPVDAVTGFPEMLDGRVKTLHPGVHGGILARRDRPEHLAAIAAHGIAAIDVVAVNLYPFRATVTATPPPAFEVGVENIDIGGPAMIRAAAKNHDAVAVVVDPADYGEVLAAVAGAGAGGGAAGAALRRRLAWKAFQHCSTYDANVAEWLWAQAHPRGGAAAPPPELTLPLRLAAPLRYGENPHQPAAFYTDLSLGEVAAGGVAAAVQHHGKEMSYNNYLDADAAYGCACDFRAPACVVVKHTNPCGAAQAAAEGDEPGLIEAYRAAVRADPTSAFGGIVAFNRPVTAALAREIREFRSPTDGETRMFYEIVVAPGYTPDGLEVLKGKSKTLRILEAPARPPSGRSLRQVGGGWLLQDADGVAPEDVEFTVVSKAQPTPAQLDDLRLAWRVAKHVKSNAITVAAGGRLLGMGSGQPNRVKSVGIALEKAGDAARGAALASDAFFPFSWGDSVEIACRAGVAAIAHPGGSVRDADAVECCDKYGVVLVTTGVRHFKH